MSADLIDAPGDEREDEPTPQLHIAASGGPPELSVAALPGTVAVWPLVPTERQLREGTDIAEFDETSLIIPEAPTRSRRDAAKAYLESIDPRSIPGSKLPLIVCCLSGFTAGWDATAIGITGPNIQASFGVSLTSLASLTSFIATLAIILGLPLGYLVDRVSRIGIIRVTETAGAIGDVVQGVGPTFGLFGVGRTLGAVARKPESGAIYPLLADAYESAARARVFGAFTFFSTLGGVISSPVVGFIVQHFGWRQASLTLAVISVTTAILTFKVREPKRGEIDRRELGVTDEPDAAPKPPAFTEAIRGAWGIKTLRLLSIAGFVGGFSAVLALINADVQAQKFGLDALQRSFIVTIQGIVLLPAVLFGSVIADRLLERRPSTLVVAQAGITFVGALCLAGAAFATNLFEYTALNVIPLVLLELSIPATIVVLSMVVPSRYRGVGLQIGTPFTLIATLVGPVLLTTFDKMGTNLQHVYLPFAGLEVVAGFITLAAAGGVATDIRAARAAALAGQESERSRQARQNKILVCRDIDVTIDAVQILFRIDLDIREGEIVALVGTNGAGKSTLLRAICGLQQASNGAIFFDGKDVTYAAPHQNARDGIVYMPGGQGVFPLMSVRDNLTSGAWMHRKDPESQAAEIERMLDLFPRLRERMDIQAGEMSGGEQQMLALAQAFLMKPRLLMIDELSLGLAPAIVEQLLDSIRQMAKQGITVMLVEQSVNVALTVAERAVFMDKGEIQFDGPVEELLSRPDLVRSVFMGGSGGGSAFTNKRQPLPAGEEPEALLGCTDISISYGGVNALTDVSLTVAAGEVVGIIGPNGAGKTTLFDVLSGYAKPDRGAVLLDGNDVTRLGPDARARAGLGRAFQNARLFPPLTVRENISIALEKRTNKNAILAAVWAPNVRASERKLQTRVDGFIELLGLGAYADKFVRELSTGTRRAVEVACQMAAEPKVLLLDEPSSGLAQAETEALGPALLRIVKETGCGMLVIEHDLPLIMGMSDRLIAMELGQVVTTGSPEAVTTDPRVLASYLAASNDVIERSGSRVGAVLASITADGVIAEAAAKIGTDPTAPPARTARRTTSKTNRENSS